MIKTAVFVEGQSELIFTRELLLKFFEYQDVWIECYNLFNDQDVWIECYNLFNDQDLHATDYAFPNDKASYYFQILNIGNDQKVLASILKREKYLFGQNQRFDKIIGLRDMYSEEYRKAAKNAKISTSLNEKFIESHYATIAAKSLYPDKVSFHFAIMELEAWLLALPQLFERLHPMLTNQKIASELQVDLQQADPETTVFHPARLVKDVLALADDSYDKTQADMNRFLGNIDRTDILRLLESNKCQSFRNYCQALQIKGSSLHE